LPAALVRRMSQGRGGRRLASQAAPKGCDMGLHAPAPPCACGNVKHDKGKGKGGGNASADCHVAKVVGGRWHELGQDGVWDISAAMSAGFTGGKAGSSAVLQRCSVGREPRTQHPTAYHLQTH
jgi:hypothetical protein